MVVIAWYHKHIADKTTGGLLPELEMSAFHALQPFQVGSDVTTSILHVFTLLPFFLLSPNFCQIKSSNTTWSIMMLQSFIVKQHLPHATIENKRSICIMHNPAIVRAVHNAIHGLHKGVGAGQASQAMA